MSGPVPYYASDGSINITMVGSSPYLGLYAAAGGINCELAPGGTYVGMYAPMGGLYVTVAPLTSTFPLPYHAPDGSVYIAQSASSGGPAGNIGTGQGLGLPVTVIGGTNPFTPSSGGALIPLLAI